LESVYAESRLDSGESSGDDRPGLPAAAATGRRGIEGNGGLGFDVFRGTGGRGESRGLDMALDGDVGLEALSFGAGSGFRAGGRCVLDGWGDEGSPLSAFKKEGGAGRALEKRDFPVFGV
jgi:hypothetical protein